VRVDPHHPAGTNGVARRAAVPLPGRRRLGRQAGPRARRVRHRDRRRTDYPDYKPATFIVSSEIDGVDMVTGRD